MKLTTEEADLFFELMWALQFYTNKKFNLIESVQSIKEYIELSQEDKMAVREKLFENLDIISDYIEENPDSFDSERLNSIAQWKHAIQGTFHIERYLKKHAIFITDDGENVYGVVALYEGFEGVFPKYYLPMMVKAILLPFKERIIYDGLMQSYNVRFGGGIKRRLKEDYMRAKQNERVITSLDKSGVNKSSEKEKVTTDQKNWSKEIGQLSFVSRKLKGGAGQPAINSMIFSLVKSCIEFSNRAVVDSADADTLLQELKKVKRAVNKIEKTLYRIEE